MTKQKLIGRRSILKGAAATAGASVIGMPSVLRAQEAGTVIVGTWGGDYARLLTKNIEDPYLIPEGWDVIHDQAGDPERRAKMMAERRLPRGTTDLQAISGNNMYQVFEQGLTQPVDYDKIPNSVHLLDSMKFEYGVGHIYSAMVAVYNPDVVDKVPTSYAEVFDPSWGDRLGIIDIQYQYTIVAAALAAGGGVADFDKGKELLLKVREGGTRIYPTNEAFAQGLKTEEIGIGIMWKARTVQWQNAGINVQSSWPKEGGIAFVSGFSVPRNAPHPDGSWAYLNAMLEPGAQKNFAIDMGYNPTVDNAGVSPELNSRIGFTPEEVATLQSLDYGAMLENDVELKNWWDREFKG